MNEGVIQIGFEEATTLRDLTEIIVGTSGKDINIQFDSSKPEGDRGRIALCKRAKEILGWSFKIKLEEGINHTYRWILKQQKT